MDFDKSIHIRPSQVVPCWRIHDEVLQEGQLLDVVPSGDEALANFLHASNKAEQNQTAEDGMR